MSSVLPKGAMTDAERDKLPEKARAFLNEAERRTRTAASLYDVGVARGLLLALFKEGAITDSQFDRMFKRAFAKVPRKLLATLDSVPTANLGGGLIVPASPRTRGKIARS
jgi:hypothetical protein